MKRRKQATPALNFRGNCLRFCRQKNFQISQAWKFYLKEKGFQRALIQKMKTKDRHALQNLRPQTCKRKPLGHRRKEGKNEISENQPEMWDDEKYLITSFLKKVPIVTLPKAGFRRSNCGVFQMCSQQLPLRKILLVSPLPPTLPHTARQSSNTLLLDIIAFKIYIKATTTVRETCT